MDFFKYYFFLLVVNSCCVKCSISLNVPPERVQEHDVSAVCRPLVPVCGDTLSKHR